MTDFTTEAGRRPVPPSCPLQRDKLVPKFCQVIPSTLDALDSLLEEATAVVKEMCCVPEEIGDVELALQEALANAILHGNQSDSNKKVVVACFCECEAGGGLLLVVRDEGAGFDPSEVPDPTRAQAIYSGHGRGIFLMRQFLDEVRFRNGGREVELRKRGEPACSS